MTILAGLRFENDGRWLQIAQAKYIRFDPLRRALSGNFRLLQLDPQNQRIPRDLPVPWSLDSAHASPRQQARALGAQALTLAPLPPPRRLGANHAVSPVKIPDRSRAFPLNGPPCSAPAWQSEHTPGVSHLPATHRIAPQPLQGSLPPTSRPPMVSPLHHSKNNHFAAGTLPRTRPLARLPARRIPRPGRLRLPPPTPGLDAERRG